MSSKQTHDTYADNIRVKISERYKPPHRINLPVRHNQPPDPAPGYDFAAEASAKEHVQRIRAARQSLAEGRRRRLEAARDDLQKRIEQRSKQEEDIESERAEAKEEEKEIGACIAADIPSYDLAEAERILQPTGGQYSGILTPIPLNAQPNASKPLDKSPFNVSDFEDDTYSPFDAVELKSINDMAELAQVLRTEESASYPAGYQSYPAPYTSFGQYGHYAQHSYMEPPANDYSHTNGYYYANPGGSYHQQYSYPKPAAYSDAKPKLANSRSAEVVPRREVAAESDGVVEELSGQDQELCRGISMMGFPAGRVARTIRLVGSDQKKVVEHLLAMADLLDLGFAEKAASSALLQCDNDRDKALDKLIS